MVSEWGSVPWNRSGQAEVRDADDPLSPQAHHSGIGNRSLSEVICHSVNLQSTCDIEHYEPGGYRADGPLVRSGNPMSGPSRCCACPLPAVLVLKRRRVLQVWARYVQYPHYPKLCDQGLRETPGRVNPAEYVKYRMIRPAAGRVWGTNPTPWEPPDLRKVGGSPILGVVEAGQFTGLCHMGGRYSGLWVVSFVSPHLWVRGRCHRIIRCVMCRLWRGRWRRSSPAVIWLRRLVVLTARPSVLSSRRWVPTALSPTSTRVWWRPCSPSGGMAALRRRGTPGGSRSRRSLRGAGSGGLWPGICWWGWGHRALGRSLHGGELHHVAVSDRTHPRVRTRGPRTRTQPQRWLREHRRVRTVHHPARRRGRPSPTASTRRATMGTYIANSAIASDDVALIGERLGHTCRRDG